MYYYVLWPVSPEMEDGYGKMNVKIFKGSEFAPVWGTAKYLSDGVCEIARLYLISVSNTTTCLCRDSSQPSPKQKTDMLTFVSTFQSKRYFLLYYYQRTEELCYRASLFRVPEHYCCQGTFRQKAKVKAVCGSYSTAALRHIVLLPK